MLGTVYAVCVGVLHGAMPSAGRVEDVVAVVDTGEDLYGACVSGVSELGGCGD